MSVPTKLAGFVAILAVTLAASFAIGRAVGPIGDPADAPHTDTAHTDTAHTDTGNDAGQGHGSDEHDD